MLFGDLIAGGGFDVGSGPDGAAADPGDDVEDFGIGEFAGGGHFELGVALADGFDEQAFFGAFEIDGGAGFAAFEEGVAGGHFEAAELGLGVAGEAIFGQDGAHFGFEKLDRVGALGVAQGDQDESG